MPQRKTKNAMKKPAKANVGTRTGGFPRKSPRAKKSY